MFQINFVHNSHIWQTVVRHSKFIIPTISFVINRENSCYPYKSHRRFTDKTNLIFGRDGCYDGRPPPTKRGRRPTQKMQNFTRDLVYQSFSFSFYPHYISFVIFYTCVKLKIQNVKGARNEKVVFRRVFRYYVSLITGVRLPILVIYFP